MLTNNMDEDVGLLITSSLGTTGSLILEVGAAVDGIYCPDEQARKDFLVYFNKSYEEMVREEMIEKEKKRNELIKKVPVFNFSLTLKDFDLKGIIEASSSLIDSVNDKLISLIEGHGKSEGE